MAGLVGYRYLGLDKLCNRDDIKGVKVDLQANLT